METFMKKDFVVDKIVLACYVGVGMGMTIHKNRPSHGLAFHMSGIKVYLFDDGQKITVNPNEIIYLPKKSSYEVKSTVPGDCYAINFNISEEETWKPFKMKVKNTLSVSENFKSARNVWDNKARGYTMKCKADLYQILYIMQQEYFAQYMSKNKLDIVRPAVEYIHRNYTSELLSIERLSEMCGITPEYFRKIFRSFYGVSPLKYINELKIFHAKELIESGMYSITESARQSGYTDMSHFSREFKKETGKSPRNFQKTITEIERENPRF